MPFKLAARFIERRIKINLFNSGALVKVKVYRRCSRKNTKVTHSCFPDSMSAVFHGENSHGKLENYNSGIKQVFNVKVADFNICYIIIQHEFKLKKVTVSRHFNYVQRQ